MRRVQLIALLSIVFLALGAASVRLRAYVLGGYVWPGTTVYYYVNSNNLYVPQADAIAALQSAASNWNTQGQANIQLVYGGQTTDASLSLNYVNEVFFRNDVSSYIAETYWYWDGAGHLIDADTVFHENYKFYTGNVGCNGDGYYIENTGTHEFGHMLGFMHSAVTTATMWATSETCATWKETLDPDDIAGLQAMYPPVSQPPTAPSQLVVATNASNPTGALSLSWTNTATNASGINVYRSSDGVNFGAVASALGASTSSYTDSGLSSGATYYYVVYTYNNAGSSGSNTASGQTTPVATATAPTAPSSPNPSNGATGVSTSVTLSWATCSGASSYDVYINGALYASNVTGRSVGTTLTASTQYSWYVIARNSVGFTMGPSWSFTTKAPVTTVKGRKK
jgi:hypothetical protein